MVYRNILVDFGNTKSIKTAEKKQSLYENRGMKLVGTTQQGLDKWRLTYESPKIRRH
jgi:hypothetical protein